MTTQSTNSTSTLWLRLLGGAAVWMLSFTIIYYLSEAACVMNFWSPSTITVMVLVVTAVALVVPAMLTYQSWHRLPSASLEEAASEDHYAVFMEYATFVLNLLFGFIILMTGLPALFLAPCTFA